MPVIEAVGLSKAFGEGVRAVDSLSFGVSEGHVCGLLGPNGAGKTTTLRMLVGLVRPSEGQARLLDELISPGSKVLASVGTMIEHAQFVPYLSGMRNLRFYWEARGDDFAAANVDRALAVAGLGDAIDRKVKTYSQGMRQRLGIARALLGSPKIMILDEPTNGLDPGEMREVRALLERLANEGVTVLLSSHLLSEVEQVCTDVVVMDKGRLVAEGTIAEFTATTTSTYLEVTDNGRALQLLEAHPDVRAVTASPPGLVLDLDAVARHELVTYLVANGIGVDTVVARRRLEDAFLQVLEHEDV
jgi:ABC-2 type transport system ATP-binding protein